jgi:hypothetical protein
LNSTDEKAPRNRIRIGFEKGTDKPVDIGVHHTVFSGITRSGKSETVHACISRAEGLRFLILDVKRPRDYAGIGVEVPIYVEEKTDPLMLKRLLESQSHLRLKFEFPELIKVCKRRDTYKSILNEINQNLEKKIHPIKESKLLVLQHLLDRLVRELEKTPIVDRLELKGDVNVMNLSEVSVELQQLAVYSTLKWILEKERGLVVVLDEAHRFVPQAGSNASKEMVTRYIKEGGAKGLWLWIVDQTITGVDKQVLKQCWIWVLGKQRELNEAKRTLDQIPFKTGLKEKNIMRLGVGHFVVCTDQFAKVTYVQPSWLPEDVAVKVALGRASVEDAIGFKSGLLGDKEMLWKEKYEALLEKYEERGKILEKYERKIGMLNKTIKDLQLKVEELSKRKPKIIEKVLEKPVEVSGKAEVSVAQLMPIIDERLNQRLLELEEVRVVNVDVNERIKDLVKDEFIADVVRNIDQLPQPAKRAARYIYEKGRVGVGDLYFFLYQKAGRPPGTFYANVVKPLEKASLITRQKGEVVWSMDEQLLARFKDFMPEEDIQSMGKYLLSLLL